MDISDDTPDDLHGLDDLDDLHPFDEGPPGPCGEQLLDTLVVDDQASLLRAWRLLLRPLGFGSAGVWMLVIDADDRPRPTVVEVQGCDAVPSDEEVEDFARFLRRLVETAPGGRVAMLRSRPGRGGPDALDRAWAAALLAAARRVGVPTDLVHLATDERVVPMPPDDLPDVA